MTASKNARGKPYILMWFPNQNLQTSIYKR